MSNQPSVHNLEVQVRVRNDDGTYETRWMSLESLVGLLGRAPSLTGDVADPVGEVQQADDVKRPDSISQQEGI